MGAHAPATNFGGLHVTLTDTQRNVAIDSKFQSIQDLNHANLKNGSRHNRNVSSCSELLLILTYDALKWVTSQFYGPLNIWWLNRKQRAAIPATFDLLVAELRNLYIQNRLILVVCGTTD
jgi:hypothetical protein